MHKVLNTNRSLAKVVSLVPQLSIATQNVPLSNKLIIPLSEGHRFIAHDEIVRLESSSNYTKIYTRSTEFYLVSKTMKVILEQLPRINFLRIHNSHVVNVNAIELLTKDHIEMTDKSTVPISRSNRKMVYERLGCK